MWAAKKNGRARGQAQKPVSLNMGQRCEPQKLDTFLSSNELWTSSTKQHNWTNQAQARWAARNIELHRNSAKNVILSPTRIGEKLVSRELLPPSVNCLVNLAPDCCASVIATRNPKMFTHERLLWTQRTLQCKYQAVLRQNYFDHNSFINIVIMTIIIFIITIDCKLGRL